MLYTYVRKPKKNSVIPNPGVSSSFRSRTRKILKTSWRPDPTSDQYKPYILTKIRQPLDSNNFRLSRNADNNNKFVYDASDLIRYRKERAINKNYYYS